MDQSKLTSEIVVKIKSVASVSVDEIREGLIACGHYPNQIFVEEIEQNETENGESENLKK